MTDKKRSWFKPPQYKLGEVDSLLSQLEFDLLTTGEMRNSGRVSGKETSESVPTLTDISFTISDIVDVGVLEEMIFAHEGLKGLNFVKKEAEEWTDINYINPGHAWEEYPERWWHSLNKDMKMDYSYNLRIGAFWQFSRVVDELMRNPNSRQAYISIYRPEDAEDIGGERRIPCIIGYQFDIDGEKKINMTVNMRSCDLENCLRNDIYLAIALLYKVYLSTLDILDSCGTVTFMINNLHMYPKITKSS